MKSLTEQAHRRAAEPAELSHRGVPGELLASFSSLPESSCGVEGIQPNEMNRATRLPVIWKLVYPMEAAVG